MSSNRVGDRLKSWCGVGPGSLLKLGLKDVEGRLRVIIGRAPDGSMTGLFFRDGVPRTLQLLEPGAYILLHLEPMT